MGFLGPPGAWPRLSCLCFGLGFAFLAGLAASWPKDASFGRATVAILCLGLVLRLPFLFLHPVNSDVFRYVFEGYVQTLGINPYRFAPADPTLAKIASGVMAGVFPGINHKELAACYPPLAELIFAGIAFVSPTPGMVKAVLAVFDLGAAVFLALILRRRGLPASRLVLYAANPLVLVFVSGQGHYDVIQGFFLAAALYFFESDREGRGFFFLGAAALSKYLAGALFPFFLLRRNLIKSLWFFAPFALFLPYVGAGGGLFASLTLLATAGRFNASLAEIARFLFGGAWPAAVLAGLGLCLACAWLVVRDRLRGAFLAAGALLLFLPTFFPWYLVLAALFAPLFPSPPWLFLQAAALAYFPVMALEELTGAFVPLPGLSLWTYLPFFCLLFLGRFRPWRFLSGSAHPAPRSLSVVIPTLNEAKALPACLASVAAAARACPGTVLEVIAADGGSRDGTIEEAISAGVRLVGAPMGRGPQIAAGIEAARGDAVLILHADCLLAPETPDRILRALAGTPEAVGGAAGMRFAASSAATRLAAFLNALRLRLSGVSFGDQGQFFRRGELAAAGGFPELYLMEDVEAALVMKERGPLLALSGGLRVSGRTWRRLGFARNFSRIALLFPRYLVLSRLGAVTDGGRAFYRAYYGRDPGSGAVYQTVRKPEGARSQSEP